MQGNFTALRVESDAWFLIFVLPLQGERATGFGVALLMALFGQASDDSMLNKVSPLGNATSKSKDQMERDCKRRRLVQTCWMVQSDPDHSPANTPPKLFTNHHPVRLKFCQLEFSFLCLNKFAMWKKMSKSAMLHKKVLVLSLIFTFIFHRYFSCLC